MIAKVSSGRHVINARPTHPGLRVSESQSLASLSVDACHVTAADCSSLTASGPPRPAPARPPRSRSSDVAAAVIIVTNLKHVSPAMSRGNWERSQLGGAGGGYHDYGGMSGGGQYSQEGGGGYDWDYPAPNAMRRGEMYQDDPYSAGQYSGGGQMYDSGRASYGGQYDMESQFADGGMYSAANLQATVMQMVSNMQQAAANSMHMGRGAPLLADPPVKFFSLKYAFMN